MNLNRCCRLVIVRLSKIKIYHFNNGGGGGVLSVIRNLLKFSSQPNIENHIIYTINMDLVKEYRCNKIEGAVSEVIFYYSAKWNFYFTCRQLAKLLPDDKAVIVAHDWLELGMASMLGLQNPVIQFLHGDYEYYYQLAALNQASIDKFITVAKNIENKLASLLPGRINNIYYLRFPVPYIKFDEKSRGNNIIFVGRLSNDKGYHLLAEVNQLLLNKGIVLDWHIVGEGINGIAYKLNGWNGASNIRFYGNIDNQKVLTILKKMEYFILPSLAEGMPVSLIEAMKAGVIPLVNDIEGGIQELIEDGVTGFKISNNTPVLYADCIEKLISLIGLSAKIGENCTSLANHLFDPVKNTSFIEEEIMSLNEITIGEKKSKRVYGSTLDQNWIPNLITQFVRKNKPK